MTLRMRVRMVLAIVSVIAIGQSQALAQDRPDGEPTIFAVITKVSKDHGSAQAQVLFEGAISEAKLLPAEKVIGNTIWRNLEICHSLKAEVKKTSEGFQVLSVRALDASMLPMNLQGIAGDCLIKKAIEVAPLVD